MGLACSLIITTWNSRPYLDECLASLREINYDGELLIVDSWSTDGTRAIIPETARYVPVADKGWSHQVNQGVRLSTYDTVIISNPDIVFNRTLWDLILDHDLARRLAGHEYNITCPALEEGNKLQKYKKLPTLIDLFVVETRIGKWIDRLLGSPIWKTREQISREGPLDPTELPTASLFITSKALLEWYPLDETLMRCEDWDLWKRIAMDRIVTVWTKRARFIHRIGHAAKNRSKREQRQVEVDSILKYAWKWNVHPRLVRWMLRFDMFLRFHS